MMKPAEVFKAMNTEDREALTELHREYCAQHGYRPDAKAEGEGEVFSKLKFIPLVTPD